jgi:hypothetical protein
MGFEPTTPTLARLCSTPELHPHDASRRACSAAPLCLNFALRATPLRLFEGCAGRTGSDIAGSRPAPAFAHRPLRIRVAGNHGFAFSPVLSSVTPSASARRALAEPGRKGRCWLSCGAQPESQTRSNVARSRLSGSAKRSA